MQTMIMMHSSKFLLLLKYFLIPELMHFIAISKINRNEKILFNQVTRSSSINPSRHKTRILQNVIKSKRILNSCRLIAMKTCFLKIFILIIQIKWIYLPIGIQWIPLSKSDYPNCWVLSRCNHSYYSLIYLPLNNYVSG